MVEPILWIVKATRIKADCGLGGQCATQVVNRTAPEGTKVQGIVSEPRSETCSAYLGERDKAFTASQRHYVRCDIRVVIQTHRNVQR